MTRRLPPWSPWREQADRPRRGWQPRHPGAVLVLIKVIHTLAWFSIESCMVYLLAAGFANRSDRRAAVAAAVVGTECLLFATNGFRCPLTQLADSFGAEGGSVTDIYLPGWFAHNLPAIHVPLIVLAAFLHGKNLRQQRKRSLESGSLQRRNRRWRTRSGEDSFAWELSPPAILLLP